MITPYEQRLRKAQGMDAGVAKSAVSIYSSRTCSPIARQPSASLTSVPTHGFAKIHTDMSALCVLLAGHETLSGDGCDAEPVEVFSKANQPDGSPRSKSNRNEIVRQCVKNVQQCHEPPWKEKNGTTNPRRKTTGTKVKKPYQTKKNRAIENRAELVGPRHEAPNRCLQTVPDRVSDSAATVLQTVPPTSATDSDIPTPLRRAVSKTHSHRHGRILHATRPPPPPNHRDARHIDTLTISPEENITVQFNRDSPSKARFERARECEVHFRSHQPRRRSSCGARDHKHNRIVVMHVDRFRGQPVCQFLCG